MLDRTAELIAQPKSPNLYWALSTLPELLELERATSFEGSLFAMSLPAVNDLDRPRGAAEWQKMADQLVELLEQLGELPPPPKPKPDASLVEKFLDRLTAAGAIQRTTFVKHARADLPGMLQIPAEKVAEMSDEEAAIRWYVRLRLARDQQAAAVLCLPPREAWPQLKQMQAESRVLKEKTGGQGPDFLNPTSIYISAWSLQRKISSLRIIEAIRHHQASHDALPAALSEITDVPIPRSVDRSGLRVACGRGSRHAHIAAAAGGRGRTRRRPVAPAGVPAGGRAPHEGQVTYCGPPSQQVSQIVWHRSQCSLPRISSKRQPQTGQATRPERASHCSSHFGS